MPQYTVQFPLTIKVKVSYYTDRSKFAQQHFPPSIDRSQDVLAHYVGETLKRNFGVKNVKWKPEEIDVRFQELLGIKDSEEYWNRESNRGKRGLKTTVIATLNVEALNDRAAREFVLRSINGMPGGSSQYVDKIREAVEEARGFLSQEVETKQLSRAVPPDIEFFMTSCADFDVRLLPQPANSKYPAVDKSKIQVISGPVAKKVSRTKFVAQAQGIVEVYIHHNAGRKLHPGRLRDSTVSAFKNIFSHPTPLGLKVQYDDSDVAELGSRKEVLDPKVYFSSDMDDGLLPGLGPGMDPDSTYVVQRKVKWTIVRVRLYADIYSQKSSQEIRGFWEEDSSWKNQFLRFLQSVVNKTYSKHYTLRIGLGNIKIMDVREGIEKLIAEIIE